MAALPLFALLFLFSLLFRPPKLFPQIYSLLLSFISPPPTSNPHKSDVDVVKINIKQKLEVQKHSAYLRTVFATFDADADGYVTAGELGASLRRLGIPATGDELITMIENVDTNGDGLIDIDEFSALYGSLRADEPEDRALRDAFDVFDGDGDGLITVEELGAVLRSIGRREGDRAEACRDMIRSVDLDGDGMVNFDEFKQMMAANGPEIFC